MLNDIMLGQYFPGTSLLHRLDPRSKIGLLFLLILGIFFFDTPASYFILTLFSLGLVILSQVSCRLVWKSLRPLWWILIFTFVVNAISVPGEELAHFWMFHITAEGLSKGFFLSLRLALLILLSSLLTFTTSPLALTDGIEAILSPGRRVGIPAHELAMMMTIALRFVPTLLQETDKIMKAQEARGSDFSTGSILHRFKSLMPVLVPLFISAFRRADELAMAMEARCYRGGEGRTRMKELSAGAVDYFSYGFLALVFILLGVCKFMGV